MSGNTLTYPLLSLVHFRAPQGGTSVVYLSLASFRKSNKILHFKLQAFQPTLTPAANTSVAGCHWCQCSHPAVQQFLWKASAGCCHCWTEPDSGLQQPATNTNSMYGRTYLRHITQVVTWGHLFTMYTPTYFKYIILAHVPSIFTWWHCIITHMHMQWIPGALSFPSIYVKQEQ